MLIKHQTGSYGALIKHQTGSDCVDQMPDWFKNGVLIKHQTGSYVVLIKHQTGSYVVLIKHQTGPDGAMIKHQTGSYGVIIKHQTGPDGAMIKHQTGSYGVLIKHQTGLNGVLIKHQTGSIEARRWVLQESTRVTTSSSEAFFPALANAHPVFLTPGDSAGETGAVDGRICVAGELGRLCRLSSETISLSKAPLP